MMASKTFLTERIKELEEKLKKQQNGNFLLKRKADELIFQNANLQKEIGRLKKENEVLLVKTKRKRFIFF
jgi:vacuolar-type H+-ATPase subunit D/Vma8